MDTKQMKLLILTLAILITISIDQVKSEAFSATANLVQLVDAENKLVDKFETYVKSEESRIAGLRKTLEDMKKAKEDIERTGDSLDYAGHPINAYSLIKRWNKISSEVSNDKAAKSFQTQYRGLDIPSDDDFTGATAALLRLQRVFDMKTEDLMKGYCFTERSVHELSLDDFYKLGVMAHKNDDYGLAVQWLEKAAEHTDSKTLLTSIYKLLSKCYVEFQDYNKAVEYAEKAFALAPSVKIYLEELKLTAQTFANNPPAVVYNSTSWQRPIADWKVNYEKLCRGELDATADPSYTKNLVCRYKAWKLPYYVFKEEILSWDPRIGMFYEVISDKDAQMIIKSAYPLLYRAVVGDPANAFKTNERVSKVAWLWDADKPEIKRLSNKVTMITGLLTEYSDQFSKSEPFQVVNYGMGGQYEPHVDYYENPRELENVPDFIKHTGDRIATFLFYLTTITHGGATVYPRCNIRVPPVKNAAAFWYNAKLNGELDKRTEHAGCPVLMGQKWVINKWIRQFGQEFTRPCGLTEDAIDKFI